MAEQDLLYWRIGPDYSDLKQYGLKALTGEACSFGMRMLCDVNDKGRRLLESFFGMTGLSLASNYNSTVEEYGDVNGSLVLGHKTLWELMIYVGFYIERCTMLAIMEKRGSIAGIYSNDPDDVAKFRDNAPEYYMGTDVQVLSNDWQEVWAPRNPNNMPSSDGRNIHQSTGRAL